MAAAQLKLFEDEHEFNDLITAPTDHPVMRAFLEAGPTMDDVIELQNYMLQNPQHGTEEKCEAKHHFSEGTYAREFFLKQGDLVIGKRHAKGHFTFLMKGDVTIITDEGQQRLVGPVMWRDAPGVKRFVYAHADAFFVTVHATSSTDLSEIEAELIVPEPVQEGE